MARAADRGGPPAGEPDGTEAGAAAGSATTPGGSTPGSPRRARRRRRAAVEWLVALVLAVVLAAALRAWVFEVFFVPTTSMEPTLGRYDRILVLKAFFNWHDVRQGDVLVFHPPKQEQADCGGPRDSDLVKRVIALPGQTIYSQGNNIYVNGRKLAEPYLPHYDPLGPPIPHASALHPFRVPAGEFYMMGDNRAISCDSRYWGPVKGTNIVGQVILLIWHDGHPDLGFF
jgi:signal peptidase I